MEILDDMMNISRLILQSFSNSLTEEEQQKLEEWLSESDTHRELYERLRTGQGREEREEFIQNLNKEHAWRKIKHVVFRGQRQWLSVVVAVAAVLVLCIFSAIFYMNKEEKIQNKVVICSEEDITIGGEKAELILADGLTIKLDSSSNKSVQVKPGVQMTFDKGNLSYLHEDSSFQMEYHTLKVPRGGFYSVTLGDGSVVYLNSSSSLRYPLQFGKSERRVFLSGEAFFEVKSDSSRAFYVEVENLNIRVYGTKFNVNTYKQGNIQTLLVEGKIGLLRENEKEVFLAPTQLADYNFENNAITLKKVNTQLYTAWKDGWFVFEDTPLKEVFMQLARWYDVDIIYLDKPQTEHRIFARMKRSDSIDIVLKALAENVDVHFKIDGKNVLVYK